MSEKQKQESAQSPEAEIPAETEKQPDQPAPDPLEALKASHAELNDRYLRSLAETENYKKRVARERQDERSFAGLDTVMAFLPVADNLERAAQSARLHLEEAGKNAVLEQLLKGVELTLKQFSGTLEKLGVTAVTVEKGKHFDPHTQEAMVQEPKADMEEGLVLEELQKGYLMAGRVIRPAMVKVSAKS
jgi:molecular chaperone GrpE